MPTDIASIAGSIDDGEVVLLVSPSDRVDAINTEIVTHYTAQGGICVYVNVSKPYTTLEHRFEKAGADTDNIFYIDCATSLAGADVGRAGNVIFRNPAELTNISLTIENALESLPGGRDRVLLFDTLSTLMLYNDDRMVSKFAHSLMTRLRNWEAKSIILTVSEETDPRIMSQLRQFADRVVQVD